jgi:hypothetical protein
MFLLSSQKCLKFVHKRSSNVLCSQVSNHIRISTDDTGTWPQAENSLQYKKSSLNFVSVQRTKELRWNERVLYACYVLGLLIAFISISFPESWLEQNARVIFGTVRVIFLVPQSRRSRSLDLPPSNKQSVLSLVALDGFSLVTSDATLWKWQISGKSPALLDRPLFHEAKASSLWNICNFWLLLDSV